MILRAAAGFAALGVAHLGSDLTDAAVLPARCVIVGTAVLIWIGLWTPIAAVAEAVLQISIVGLGQELNTESLVYAALGLGLAMLGPGCWSLDSRLFGRKRIV